ncbi:MAG: DUF2062 domain-containing protein, partial [Novosphingobium sp.]
FWLIGYEVGAYLLRMDSMVYAGPLDGFLQVTDLWSFLTWFTAQGKVLALGLFVVGTVAAAASYLLTSFTWRWWIAHKRRARIERSRHRRAVAAGESGAG